MDIAAFVVLFSIATTVVMSDTKVLPDLVTCFKRNQGFDKVAVVHGGDRDEDMTLDALSASYLLPSDCSSLDKGRYDLVAFVHNHVVCEDAVIEEFLVSKYMYLEQTRGNRSLYGPAWKALVLYMIGRVPLGKV